MISNSFCGHYVRLEYRAILLHADSDASDQTGWMLIVKPNSLVLTRSGSNGTKSI